MKQRFSRWSEDNMTQIHIDVDQVVPLTEEHGQWLIDEAIRQGIDQFLRRPSPPIVKSETILPFGYPIALGDTPESVVQADGIHSYQQIVEMLAQGTWFKPVVLAR